MEVLRQLLILVQFDSTWKAKNDHFITQAQAPTYTLSKCMHVRNAKHVLPERMPECAYTLNILNYTHTPLARTNINMINLETPLYRLFPHRRFYNSITYSFPDFSAVIQIIQFGSISPLYSTSGIHVCTQ